MRSITKKKENKIGNSKGLQRNKLINFHQRTAMKASQKSNLEYSKV